MLLFFYLFLSGAISILAPAALFVLVAMIAFGVGGTKLKPFFIIIGFVFSFGVFGSVLLSHGSFLGIDHHLFRILGGNMLVVLGLLRIIRQVNHNKHNAICRMNAQDKIGHTPGPHIVRGLLVGLALGMAWIPSTGPFLGTAMLLGSADAFAMAAAVLFATYALGLSVICLTIVYIVGNLIIQMSRVEIAAHTVMFFLGLAVIAVGLAFISGADVSLSQYLFPSLPFSFLAV